MLLLFACIRPVSADEESPKLQAFRPQVDRAVDLSLAFLAHKQAEHVAHDGAFDDWNGQTNAMAGLVGMAFLAKGYRPGSPPYGDVIDRSIDYILATQTNNGYLGIRSGVGEGERMYGHAIATLYLSEVSGMVDEARQQKIDVMLPRALKVILDAQQVPKNQPLHNGGWRYSPDSKDSDISVTGWCLMALRSARLNGAPVPQQAIQDALAYVERCVHVNGGFKYTSDPDFFYQRRNYWVRFDARPGCTAVGLLCRELSGRHADEMNLKAAEYLLAKVTPAEFLCKDNQEYAVYYASQGLFQLGGETWEKFAEQMYGYLLPKQQNNGAWFSDTSGEVYPTAMYTLALSVTYRQLPIYQR